jgi:crotonobetainyl-CoA:carnitine CoA-transferase CaiB-like acyl-CoA transferase
VVAEPGLRARGLFYRMTAEDGRAVPQVNTGIRLDGAANAPRAAPPRLGEHGPEVLRTLLGKSEDEIGRLADAGVI